MSLTKLEQLEGKDAIDFAERYLKKIRTDGLNWEIEYEDPITGDRWMMDYPHSEAHGGGSPRLRKLPLR
jgi:Immunity protein 27